MSIGSQAFYNCSNLVTVNVAPIVRENEWGWSGWSDDVFSGCKKIKLASQAAIKRAGYEGSF
jgi:hypothetical protein